MLTEFILKYRKIVVLSLNLIFIIASNLLAFLIRFEGKIPPNYIETIGITLPFIILVRLTTFHFFDINTGLWRYVSIRDLLQIIKGIILSSAATGLIIYLVLDIHSYPLSILILDTILLIMFIGGIRFGTRLYREGGSLNLAKNKPVFIYGAGDAGELLLRDMLRNNKYNYQPIGFIDDDENKKGFKIHSIPVLGAGKDLNKLITKFNPEEIIIAIPSAKSMQMSAILNECKKHKVILKTLPSLKDIISGEVSVSQIRDIYIEDLLFREPVKVSFENIKDLVNEKKVLVTGAAGSIGSELVRQILRCNPRQIVLYDRNENGLYQIDHELGEKYSRDLFKVVVGDICDVKRLYMKFKKFSPQIIFHAAAYKHVPLMEDNVVESIKNNTLGVWKLAELAEQFGVETFIQISTDKVVNPTSIMGVSKRIAEMVIKHKNIISGTRFVVVRFGNVLDSSGSVVPLFKDQIRKGGPVTVTHPDIHRYFMTIPEAVQLVLQAAYIGKGGEVYVLDMGEPVKIVHLARNMITLSGLIPDKDIKIVFTGLRKGEKLYEELFDKEEKVIATPHGKIFMAVSSNNIDSKKFFSQLMELQTGVLRGDKRYLIEKMKELVPTYNPAFTEPYKGVSYIDRVQTKS